MALLPQGSQQLPHGHGGAAAMLVDTALKRQPNDSDRMKESFTRKLIELAARANQMNHSKKQKAQQASAPLPNNGP